MELVPGMEQPGAGHRTALLSLLPATQHQRLADGHPQARAAAPQDCPLCSTEPRQEPWNSLLQEAAAPPSPHVLTMHPQKGPGVASRTGYEQPRGHRGGSAPMRHGQEVQYRHSWAAPTLPAPQKMARRNREQSAGAPRQALVALLGWGRSRLGAPGAGPQVFPAPRAQLSPPTGNRGAEAGPRQEAATEGLHRGERVLAGHGEAGGSLAHTLPAPLPACLPFPGLGRERVRCRTASLWPGPGPTTPKQVPLEAHPQGTQAAAGWWVVWARQSTPASSRPALPGSPGGLGAGHGSP